jgi:hypothetical protein
VRIGVLTSWMAFVLARRGFHVLERSGYLQPYQTSHRNTSSTHRLFCN